MKYIKNTKTFDMVLKIKDETGEELEYGFPCFRRYSDTGSVYSSGVTALEDGDVELLKQNKQFNKLLASRELEWATKKDFTESANELEAATKENESLKAEVEELKKQVTNASSEELQKALAENEELKKKLETLGKSTQPASETKEDKPKEDKPETGSKNKDNKDETGDTGGF